MSALCIWAFLNTTLIDILTLQFLLSKFLCQDTVAAYNACFAFYVVGALFDSLICKPN